MHKVVVSSFGLAKKKKTENVNKLVKVADQNSMAFLVLFR